MRTFYVLKGGSWKYAKRNMKSPNTRINSLTVKDMNYGFRLMRKSK